jgi:GT2 family glycosyltransferase
MGLSATSKPDKPWEVFSPCAASALYKADALSQVGGFDEDFFCYMEDIDLGFRLRLAGYRCMTVPDAEVLHVGSATTGKRSPFYVYYGQRNLVWTYFKNMPGVLFWLFLPLHVALNIAGLLRYALSGQFQVVWSAKYDAIHALPKIWKKRRGIQKSRQASLTEILKVLDKRPVPGLGRAMSSLWK